MIKGQSSVLSLHKEDMDYQKTPLVFNSLILQHEANIPQEFIWPDHEKPNLQKTKELVVPLVDLGGFLSGRPSSAKEASVVVGDACKKHGFFLVTNHGVDASLIADAHRYMDLFFELPLLDKQRAQRKLGESCGYASSFTGRFSSKLPWKETLSFQFSGEKGPANGVKDYFENTLGKEFTRLAISVSFCNEWRSIAPNSNRVVVKNDRVCKYWVSGSCSFGDQCQFLHSWCTGSCFAMLTQLEGHQKVVSGIALPVGSDKLYTGSKDETVRVWDCQSGQCAGVINLGGEVGCMLSEGPWMFVGLPNLVKAWNVQTSAELSLNGPVGQVYSLAVGNELLFAGVQDGNILAWKYNTVTNCFEPVTALQGHSAAVVTLVVGANRLYSGSMDNSIRVWNLENLQCLQTLTDHTSVVMSVLCWDQFLLSCSLDKTIKVWAATDSGNLEATYTHSEEHGLLTLCGMHDLESKPVLLCACNDNTVRAYDLPSFMERGKIFAKQEIRSIQGGPNIFFTGDGTGEVRVWKWLADQSATPA